MSADDNLGALIHTGGPDVLGAAEELTALLDLPTVGVEVRGAQIVGQGSRASVLVTLSNGETLEFDSVRDMVRPQNLIAEVAACTGACPTLKQPQAVRAVALVRAIAERTATASQDDIAAAWGVEYLQAAETLEVDLRDQRGRYAAFERIARRDPWTHARDQGTTFTAATIVLRDTTDERLVRTEWFLRHVRSFTARETPESLSHRMQRVKWARRGSRGRIKATAPSTAQTLAWAFWIVPAGWEEDR